MATTTVTGTVVQQPLSGSLAHDLEAFLADIGFGWPSSHGANSTDPSPDPEEYVQAVTTPDPDEDPPESTTSAGSGDHAVVVVGSGGAGGDEEEEGRRRIRRLRRRISNRESARRSRARKQRHLEEQRATAAALRAGNRDLAARLRGARARAGLVALANARLRAEVHALGHRLAAAHRALALRQLYDHYYAAAGAGAGLDVQTQLASLIA